jgi:hypothetical protein
MDWADLAVLAGLLTLQAWWITHALGELGRRDDRLEDRAGGVETRVAGVEAAVGLAQREGTTASDWADLALRAAGAPGEDGQHNAAPARRTDLISPASRSH